MIKINRIYTRTGDNGTTGLVRGPRRGKDDLRVEAYGTVDEANSFVGLARLSSTSMPKIDSLLARVQNDLFDLGADLSVPYAGPDERLRVGQPLIDRLEALCDEHNALLPELKSFVLPGGTEAASRIHVCRTVCRRAELAVLEAASVETVNPLTAVYLNRLSDLFFILSRAANLSAGRDEPLWRPGA